MTDQNAPDLAEMRRVVEFMNTTMQGATGYADDPNAAMFTWYRIPRDMYEVVEDLPRHVLALIERVERVERWASDPEEARWYDSDYAEAQRHALAVMRGEAIS